MSGTLIAMVLGFVASIAPEILRVISDALKQRREKGKPPVAVPVPTPVPVPCPIPSPEIPIESSASTPMADVPAVIASDSNKWMSFLRSSVRPVLTYAFFAIFVLVKIRLLYTGLYVQHLPISDVYDVVWDTDSAELLAVVLAFWFGSRATVKVSRIR